jgi:DNA-binding beta-propeller fold protein YncE
MKTLVPFIKKLPATRYPLYLLLVTCLLSLLSSCAAPKAYIDKTAMRQIIWPGPPERPRIQYLWSISHISTRVEGRKRGLIDFIIGDVSEDVTDPRTSNVLMRPYGIFYDSKEKLYITDPGAYRITVVDLKTSYVLNIFNAGKEELLSPVGIVADPGGRIYVSDSDLRKIFAFNEKGEYLFQFEGEFKRPTCMAIDNKNLRIYISDTLEHKIYIYSLEGKRSGSIGGPGSLQGEFNFPTHLFVDREGALYVTDAMNFRVQMFNSEGKSLGSIGILGDAQNNFDKPKGVAVDSEGNIYVVDSIKDTVKIFNSKGDFLMSLGTKGGNFGDFYLPSGIFIDQKNTIYVADTYNKRIQAFQFIGGE